MIFERFDDEIVAIHLDSGAYYSMTGAAADAFALLSQDATAPELTDALAAKYGATSDEIATALAAFLAQLQKEQLIALMDMPTEHEAPRLAGDRAGAPFVPPVLEAFHDLQNILLLDPIHEVGEEGWPQPVNPVAN